MARGGARGVGWGFRVGERRRGSESVNAQAHVLREEGGPHHLLGGAVRGEGVPGGGRRFTDRFTEALNAVYR